MLPGLELMGCPLAVPGDVMRHVVHVESSYNPYAIGVVGGHLARQPRSLQEALATVRMLESRGYNFSLGLAQVNRHNLGKYGLETYAEAFRPCANLLAGSRILAECNQRAGGHWGKSFSCYYSGNFVTGYRQGYVQKIERSMWGDRVAPPGGVAPIPVVDARALSSRRQRTPLAEAGRSTDARRPARKEARFDTPSLAARRGEASIAIPQPFVPTQPQVLAAVAAGPATTSSTRLPEGMAAPQPAPATGDSAFVF